MINWSRNCWTNTKFSTFICWHELELVLDSIKQLLEMSNATLVWMCACVLRGHVGFGRVFRAIKIFPSVTSFLSVLALFGWHIIQYGSQESKFEGEIHLNEFIRLFFVRSNLNMSNIFTLKTCLVFSRHANIQLIKFKHSIYWRLSTCSNELPAHRSWWVVYFLFTQRLDTGFLFETK